MKRELTPMRSSLRTLISVLFVLCACELWSQVGAQPHFDLVITNGHIIDGTGSPWYSGDLGIRERQGRRYR